MQYIRIAGKGSFGFLDEDKPSFFDPKTGVLSLPINVGEYTAYIYIPNCNIEGSLEVPLFKENI